jgi:crotonobetainyl-CoA:carnitine CoA-transferase CaiB-like acyl-CoA transferase
MTDKPASGPLHGVKVLELGHVMAGPVCGMMLADMGADVIKLEKTSGGVDSRRMVPPQIKDESAAFLVLNRNKRGIAVDLKSPQGIEIVKKLIQEVDILIENFRLGTMERLGLEYEMIQKLSPRLLKGAPVLGEHTREILGFSADQINQLKSEGVVKTAD